MDSVLSIVLYTPRCQRTLSTNSSSSSVEENAQVLTVRERDCGVVKVKGVEGNGRQFLSSSDEHHFYLFTIQFKLGLCNIKE